ncbi:MAG: 3'-5' exonuclease [Natronosporangium sp.]
MDLVALDLEGSGAQDRDAEAILEIAVVPIRPIRDLRPDPAAAYHTLINPGRTIPRRPWISPGLTNAALRDAPPLAAVEPELARRINGRYLVGHNVGVDWRLLHRRCPTLTPAGLIDTLRIARRLSHAGTNSLTALVAGYYLTGEVDRAASSSTPHRALWDTIAAATLLAALLREALGRPPTPDDTLAFVEPLGSRPAGAEVASQPGLFD